MKLSSQSIIRLTMLLLTLLLLALSPSSPTLRADDHADFFRNKVEPLLKQHCYQCHSHAAGQMENGLALDWRSGWEKGGSQGPAIVPGKPDESLLIKAISHLDPDLKMPARQLDAADIMILTQWVRQGAFDDRVSVPKADQTGQWWSLMPLVSRSIPIDEHGSQHPIDAFIASQLTSVGLSPSPLASPRDLMRRLHFDLVGLPPTRELVASFEADPSDAHYQQIVDRLLASPRYGERWARHWLDTIHFADSHGYEHDVARDNAWPFRDYVIDALNSDRAWPDFIRQQLAVDFFEPESSHLMPALGFLGAGTFDYSTYQTGPVTFDYMDRDDMLTQTTSAFMSVTANCARCHTHKFDPITQEDYYALQAVFAGIVKGDIPYDSDPSVAAQRSRSIALLEAAKRGDADALRSEYVRNLVHDWQQERGAPAPWEVVNAKTFLSTEGATLTRNAEQVIVASGVSPDIDTYLIGSDVIGSGSATKRVTAVRLELFPHESLPMRGPGRCTNGNLHLSQFELTLFSAEGMAGQRIPIAGATADFNQEGWEIHRAIDQDPKTAWGIHPAVGQPHHAVFELAQPLDLPTGSTLTFTLRQLHGGSHLIGAFRLSLTAAPVECARALPIDVQQALAVPEMNRTETQSLAIARQATTEFARKMLDRLPPPNTVYAAAAKVAIPLGSGKSQAASIATPKIVHLLARGDIASPQAEVKPGAISALQHSPARFIDITSKPESARRAALADWIAHRDNVLTWRSVVNRVWHYHFGRGICDTPSDLGRMGGVPSHPELIDWLAVWFRDEAHGSLKQLHRLIVTSHTYRQSSSNQPGAVEKDSENRLLWRQNRLRLDADAYRDYVLATSSRMDLKMGGAAIQHFHQSPGAQLTPKLDYASYDWSTPGASRRSIYRYVWRGIPDPLMSALDFPDLGLLTPARSQSISPLQALALFNNNFVLFHSQAMAEDVESQAYNLDGQIAKVIACCYQRSCDPDEYPRFRMHVEKHGLASFCRLVLNSSEFLLVP